MLVLRDDGHGSETSASHSARFPPKGESQFSQRVIVFSTRILRKQDNLPRYIIVKPEHVLGRDEAFEALVQLNGCPPFKRNIRPWGKDSAIFFFNLSQPQCQKANLETDDACVVSIQPTY